MNRYVLTAAALLLTQAAAAQSPTVSVERPWSRATPPGARTGAAYMTLRSVSEDRLIGVTSPASTATAIHEMKMDGNVMQMREVEGGLVLPAGRPVTLAPGGFHLMLMGLAAPLKQGDTLKLRLTFAHAPPIDVLAPIAGIGASAPPR